MQIETIRKSGIKPQLSYVIGFPEETLEDLKLTLESYLRYKFDSDVESQI